MARLERILCVEDDPDMRAVISMALVMLGGFTVELCASGPAALERVSGFHPDLILLDVMMPGLDGPATLAALRRQAGAVAVPVMFMTAEARPGELARLLSLGALAVIAKPFDPMALAGEIRGHWSRRHAG